MPAGDTYRSHLENALCNSVPSLLKSASSPFRTLLRTEFEPETVTKLEAILTDPAGRVFKLLCQSRTGSVEYCKKRATETLATASNRTGKLLRFFLQHTKDWQVCRYCKERGDIFDKLNMAALWERFEAGSVGLELMKKRKEIAQMCCTIGKALSTRTDEVGYYDELEVVWMVDAAFCSYIKSLGKTKEFPEISADEDAYKLLRAHWGDGGFDELSEYTRCGACCVDKNIMTLRKAIVEAEERGYDSESSEIPSESERGGQGEDSGNDDKVDNEEESDQNEREDADESGDDLLIYKFRNLQGDSET